MIRKISKTISLEPFKSRIPSIMPSYSGGTLYFFDEGSVEEREGEYPTNYSMFPINIWLQFSISDEVFLMSSSLDDVRSDAAYHDGRYKCYSFNSLSEHIHFFTSYYSLLNSEGHCGRVYTSACDYYGSEIRLTNPLLLRMGGDRETYEALDAEFKEKHGRAVITTYQSTCGGDSPYGGNVVTEVTDDGFFKWLENNVVPCFTIPNEYRDAWTRDKLYPSDVKRWIIWFENHADDCCTKEKYEKLGGDTMLDLLKDWSYTDIWGDVYDAVGDEYWNKYWAPYTFTPITIQVNARNEGLQDMELEEYKLGEKYSINTSVIRGDEVIKKVNNEPSFLYDDYYKEMSFNEEAWETQWRDESRTPLLYEYYGYKYDHTKVTGNSSADVISQLHDDFKGYTNGNLGFIRVDDTFYEIYKGEIFTFPNTNSYLGGSVFIVYRDDVTETPYIEVNYKRKYAILDESTLTYSFSQFGSDVTYPLKGDDEEVVKKLYYIKNGAPYIVNEALDNRRRYKSYIVIDGCTIMHKYTGITTAITWDGSLEEYDKTTSKYDNGTFILEYSDKTFYYTRFASGQALSQLSTLKSTEYVAHDLKGNELGGLYPPNENAWLPTAYSVLEPIYQSGNVANVQSFIKTNLNSTPIECVGDIITSIKVYMKLYDGTIGPMRECARYGIVSAIEDCKAEAERMKESGYTFMGGIFTDIEYYMGATLKKDAESGEYTMGDDGDFGVRYTEHGRFVKKEVEFIMHEEEVPPYKSKLSQYKATNRKLSYPIYVYELVREPIRIENSTRNEDGYKDYTADTYFMITNCKSSVIAPIFTKEYNIGVSYPQSVEHDIYIERGRKGAFEDHIKLGEVTSLEALENYGNGYFKFLE